MDNHILRSLNYNENQDSEYLKWVKILNSSTYKIDVFKEKSPIFKDYNRYSYSGSMKHNRGIARHRLHSSFEKSVIERAMEYVKDRTENFDDYYPCRKRSDCNLNHVYR
ncbi:MAG TPA: hypothetical protein VKA95_13715 [Nitrososphaeraceae archaeon]|nr:hypothetical protein [Nitrososphaeraceae archaeon]